MPSSNVLQILSWHASLFNLPGIDLFYCLRLDRASAFWSTLVFLAATDSASSQGRFLLDFLKSLLTVSVFRISHMMPSNCIHAICKNLNWGLFLTAFYLKLFPFIKLSTTVAHIDIHSYVSSVISVSNFFGLSYRGTPAFFCICFCTYLVEFLFLIWNREVSFYFFWISDSNHINHWCHYSYMKIDGLVLRRCATQGRKAAVRLYTMLSMDCTSAVEKPLKVQTLQSRICIREYYRDHKKKCI